MQKLTCSKARDISLVEILQKLGNSPTKETSNDAWFLSPFRKEIKASFKVSKSLNRWFDHGLGKGGNTIDLIMQLKRYSVKETLEFLSRNISSFSFHQQSKYSTRNDEIKNYKITKVRGLENHALMNYLKYRKINIEVAKTYCQEIYYEINEKSYFAISFKNNSDGFEIRNKYFKGCLGNKNFTLLKNSSDSVLIFEGFFDFISYLSLDSRNEKRVDFIILNSINMIEKIDKILQKYIFVFTLLDNDSPGEKGFEVLKSNHKNVIDMSYIYEGFNDLNECLMNKKRSLLINNIPIQIG